MKRLLNIFERSLAIAVIIEGLVWLVDKVVFPGQRFAGLIFHYEHVPGRHIARWFSLGSSEITIVVINVLVIALILSPFVMKTRKK